MTRLSDKFPPVGVTKLKDKFPLPRTVKLSDRFPRLRSKRGSGSGFLDSRSVEIAVPVYQPPVPSFSAKHGTQSSYLSTNVTPGPLVSFSGFGSFILTNTTDGTTYTSLQWKVKNVQTGNYLLTGINQTYVILPDPNPTGIQSWEIELTAFYQGLEGKAYMRIQTSPASLNGSVLDYTTTTTAVVGDVVPFSFTNTSAGPYTSFGWSSTGITLVGTGTTVTGSITVDFANIQQPFTVILTLYGPASEVLETVSQTTTFIVLPRAVARLNGNNNNFTTTTTALEGTVVNFSFVNNSTGTYDSYTWTSSPGFVIVGTGTTVTASLTMGFPNTRPPVTVTLTLFRNLVAVDSVTQTVNFVVTALYGRSIFQIAGIAYAKFTDPINTIDTFIQYTGQTLILGGHPYYSETNFYDTQYTRPSFSSSIFYITGPTNYVEIPLAPQGQISLVPIFAPATTSAIYKIRFRTFDANGIENGQSWLNVLFSLGVPIASLDNNTTNYTTADSVAIGGTVVPFTFTNTSNAFARIEWSSTGITLAGTGNTRTGSITTNSSSPITFTVTLRVFVTETSQLGTITRTTTVRPNLNNSLFDLVGYRSAKKVNDGIQSQSFPTDGISSFQLYSYPFYSSEGPFYDYQYTRPSFTTRRWDITSSLTGLTTVTGATLRSYFLNVTFPGNAPSNTFNIVLTTFDAAGVQSGISYLDVTAINTPAPIVSLDNNTVNYTTTYVATLGVNNFTFTNTTTGGNGTTTWSSTGITLVGTGNITRTAAVNVTGPLTFTVTISVANSAGVLHGTVTRTTNIVLSSPANNQVIMTNAVSMLDMTPQPQSNVSNYSGIHVRWIPTGVGVAAGEPTSFKVQTIGTTPVSATFNHYQGNNSATASLTMSVDGTLSSPTSELYTLSSITQTISESMTWQPNYLGSQTFTNSFVNQASTLTFNQAINTNRFFDSLNMSVRTGTTKQYVTAYSVYFSNSGGISTASILANANYFISGEGRYIANQNGLSSVTFQLPAGNRYIAVMSGGVTVSNPNTILYSHVHTGFQASLHNITSRVSSNLITFSKAAGAQGSVMGFFILNV
jgi:hypothetical protein